MTRTGIFLLGLALLPLSVQAQPVIEVGRFSAAQAEGAFPGGWQPFLITKTKKPTEYSLVSEDGKVVVKAAASSSASGLIREIRINPKEYPIVQWRWKVANLIPDADLHHRPGDDSPARLLIGFQGDVDKLGFLDRMVIKSVKSASGHRLPYATLNYAWENRAPKDTIIPSPSSKRIRVIVVESGAARLNQWLSEERNVYEDYKRVFNEEPEMISGVVIMTDSDNTDEAATAYYGDIVFKKKAPEPREVSAD